MDIKRRSNKELNFREHTVVGTVTKESLVDYLKEFYASPEFDPGMNVLWDLREADLNSFSLPEVVSVRDFVERSMNKPRALKAAVVVSTQLGLSLASMYETLREGSAVTVKAFFDVDEARGWIIE